MKTNLDHLPPRHQDKLARVRTLLLDECGAAVKSGGGGTAEGLAPLDAVAHGLRNLVEVSCEAPTGAPGATI